MRSVGLVMMALLIAGQAAAAAEQKEPLPLAICSELELRVGGLFRVGTARLYLPDCDRARADILAPVPKQFSLMLARRFSGEDLSDTAYQLLRRNLNLADQDPLPDSLACLASAYVDADIGDRYDVSYHPLQGLALHLNGHLIKRCENSGEAEAYFSIWFGESPFHRRMRDVLLDRAESSSGRS